MGKKDKKKKREAEQAAAEETAPEVEETPLETAERERDELRALWQRSQADYQNLKRRIVSDTEQAVEAARATLMADLLVVLDYLDMALAAPVENPEAKNLRVGVEMTRQQFWSSFERQGVSPISTEGAFDPDLHQAVSTVETEEHEAGTILEVVRKGYRLPDSILRHAQVKVAPLPASEEAEEAEEASETEASEEQTVPDAAATDHEPKGE